MKKEKIQIEKILLFAKDANPMVKKTGYRAWISYRLKENNEDYQVPWQRGRKKVPIHVLKGVAVVFCPTEGCNNVVIVDNIGRLHFCPECLNSDNKNRPYHVNTDQLPKIAELLSHRKTRRSRTYTPVKIRGRGKGRPLGLEDLDNENRRMGLTGLKEYDHAQNGAKGSE